MNRKIQALDLDIGAYVQRISEISESAAKEYQIESGLEPWHWTLIHSYRSKLVVEVVEVVARGCKIESGGKRILGIFLGEETWNSEVITVWKHGTFAEQIADDWLCIYIYIYV